MKPYLILIRPYGMLFLGFTPVFGAIANGEFQITHLLILLIIGMLAHIFTFVQNDYYDVDVDSKSKYVSNRPIVTGLVTQKTAFVIFSFSLIISLILTILFFFTLYSIIVLLLAHLFISLYNKYSKRFFGMEYILGIGIFSYGIFGALTVSENISNLAIIIALMGFLQWLFSVGISANLKDVEFDSKLKIKTTPTVFGVHISEKKLKIPVFFILYAFIIKFIHILIALFAFILGYISISIYKIPIPLLCFFLLSIIIIYLTWKILSTPMSKRDKMLIYEGLQEGLSQLLIPIILLSSLVENIGIIPTFLLILILILWPLFWFRVLFGKKMIPLE